jgi:hypothetical protein
VGFGNGQFNEPSDVAVDSSGHVFVADQLNYRIQEFGNFGAFVAAWGTQGSGNGQFNVPVGVDAFTSGTAVIQQQYVYVADDGNHRIQVFKWEPEARPDVKASENTTVNNGENTTVTKEQLLATISRKCLC